MPNKKNATPEKNKKHSRKVTFASTETTTPAPTPAPTILHYHPTEVAALPLAEKLDIYQEQLQRMKAVALHKSKELDQVNTTFVASTPQTNKPAQPKSILKPTTTLTKPAKRSLFDCLFFSCCGDRKSKQEHEPLLTKKPQ